MIFNVMLSKNIGGGSEQVYFDYSRILRHHGYKLINISTLGSPTSQKFKPDHQLININSWCILSRIYLFLLCLYYRPKIIIAHNRRAITFSSVAKILGVKILSITHLDNKYHYLKKCDYVIALTKQLSDSLTDKGFPKDRIFRLPNMVHFPKTEISKVKLGKASLTIGAIGRLVKEKGFDYLIEAVAILKKRGIDVRLRIAGEGEENEALRAQISDLQLTNEVEMVGWVTDKAAFYQSIDIFCLPSTYEPFGLVVLEAMSFGRPVVATESGGPSSIMSNLNDGILVKPANASALAVGVSEIMAQPDRALKMVDNAYVTLKTKFSEEVVGAGLVEIIEKIS